MPRQIIILEQLGWPSDLRLNVCFWLAVPAARQQYYVNPSFKSQVIGITANETNALQMGQVFEDVQEFSYPVGTGGAAIQADLVAKYTARQTDFNNMNSKYNRYGWSYDGTSWTLPT